MLDLPVQFTSGVGVRLHRVIDAVPDALLLPSIVTYRDRKALAVP
jgi:hypothetical protein